MSTVPMDPDAHSPVLRVGEHVFDAVTEIGDVAQFSAVTIGWIFRKMPRWSTLIPNFYAIGVSSIPVVAITGTFIGMVLAVQAYAQFHRLLRPGILVAQEGRDKAGHPGAEASPGRARPAVMDHRRPSQCRIGGR
jgi:hypothetical protein